MPQPFDYSLNLTSPVAALQSGMDWRQNQLMNKQGMAMNDQAMALNASAEDRTQTTFDQGQQDREAGMAAAQAQNADFVALAEKVASGQAGVADFAALATKYPDVATQVMSGWEGVSSERKATDVAGLYKGVAAIKAGRPDIAITMLEERATAADNAGDKLEADTSRAMAAAIKADPAAGLASLGFLLQVADPDAAKAVFGDQRSGESRFKVVGDQLIDLDAEGGPAPVPGIARTDLGPEWVDLKPDELAQYGFVFGQRNTKTGKVEGEKPPKGQTISLGPDGSLTITDGVSGTGGLTNANMTDAQKASMAYESLVSGLDDYELAFKNTGGEILPGAGKDALTTARRGLQLQMKELFNLGVLNGPDLELLDSMLVDPTSLVNNALSATGIADLPTRFADNLAQVRKMMKDMVEPKLKALGSGSADMGTAATGGNTTATGVTWSIAP